MRDSIDERLKLDQNAQVNEIEIQKIKANPYQPRKTFDQARLKDLAESIQLHGILQPIVLRKTIAGYNIVVGERRYRRSEERRVGKECRSRWSRKHERREGKEEEEGEAEECRREAMVVDSRS